MSASGLTLWGVGLGVLSLWLAGSTLVMRKAEIASSTGRGTLSKAFQLKLQSPLELLGRLGLMYAKPSAASGCAISDNCNFVKKSCTHRVPPPSSRSSETRTGGSGTHRLKGEPGVGPGSNSRDINRRGMVCRAGRGIGGVLASSPAPSLSGREMLGELVPW